MPRKGRAVDRKDKDSLLAEGYTEYKVIAYKPEDREDLDRASESVPAEHHIEGSVREKIPGGKALTDLEDGYFLVYLPPEDLLWGSKSQMPTPGFHPSQEGAEREFRRWLTSLR